MAHVTIILDRTQFELTCFTMGRKEQKKQKNAKIHRKSFLKGQCKA